MSEPTPSRDWERWQALWRRAGNAQRSVSSFRCTRRCTLKPHWVRPGL